MSGARRDVIVIGGGVIGLACALRLAEDRERRFAVEVRADAPGPKSLSRVAGAMWFPYAVEHPNLRRWVRDSLAGFAPLAQVAESGVIARRAVEVVRRKVADPAWKDDVPGFRRGIPKGLPGLSAEYVDGWTFDSYAVEMPRFLPYLVARLERAGARIVERHVRSLDDAAPDGVVVNCTGSLARAFVPDDLVRPNLGQLVRIERGPIEEFRVDEEGDGTHPAYIVPRTEDCILGSVNAPWSPDTQGYEPPAPDPEVTRGILERCARLDARVLSLKVLDSRCGLRPIRPVVRLEIDAARRARGQRVIHCYGHGGAGVTLSFGCAAEVAELVEEV